MNTHDIELPPLPSPFGIVDPMGSGEKIYTLKDMGDYARAYARDAIEAALQSQVMRDVLEKAHFALRTAQAHAPCPLYEEAIEAIEQFATR